MNPLDARNVLWQEICAKTGVYDVWVHVCLPVVNALELTEAAYELN
jgi:hypothetical protein